MAKGDGSETALEQRVTPNDLAEYFQKLYPKLLWFLTNKRGVPIEEAKEMIQDVFLETLMKVQAGDCVNLHSAFFYSACFNKAFDRLRKIKGRPSKKTGHPAALRPSFCPLPEYLPLQDPFPAALEQAQLNALALQVLSQLKGRQGIVLGRRFLEGDKLTDIGASFGVSKSMAGVDLGRALEAFRVRFTRASGLTDIND